MNNGILKMIKKLTCIECPKGCRLSVEIKNKKLISVEGNECIKGEKYAKCEVENPVRFITSTVFAKGLSLRMVPVRTDKPVPKSKIKKAMEQIRKTRITKPVKVGDVIIENLLNLRINLIASREIH
jgi:CxxC motif-containing protein